MNKLVNHIININPDKYSYLDSKNILWKIIEGKIIGKRCIDTVDRGIRWKDELLPSDKIYKWLHPESADYEQIFTSEIY